MADCKSKILHKLALKTNYQHQMNILNGNAELDEAVTEYVTYLEAELKKGGWPHTTPIEKAST